MGGKLRSNDSPESSSELTYTGLLQLGGIYYSWAVAMKQPLNLNVGKGQLSPTSGETGDTFTGTATVTEAVNPVEVHVFKLNGTETQRGSSNSYVPVASGNLTYHKEVTDDNNISPVIGASSDPVFVTASAGPTATMHGLRFEAARKTWLETTQQDSGAVFTYSVWLKPTKSTASNTVNLTFIESNPNANNIYRESFRVYDDSKSVGCIQGGALACSWTNVQNP